MSANRKKNPSKPDLFPLEKLNFYFDQVERDRQDSIGSSGRTLDVMQIRNQLLTLPDGQFLPTLKAIKSILQGSTQTPELGSKDKKNPKSKSTTQTKLNPSPPSWSEDSGLSPDQDNSVEPPAAVVKILHGGEHSDPAED